MLVAVDGKPLRRPESGEIATTRDGRDITRGWVTSDLPLAPQDSVLTTKGGYDIYRDILRDDQVASCFQQRRMAVIAREYSVDAGGPRRVDKKAADFLTELLQHVGWDNVTDKMLYSVFYGYAVAECLYARDGQQVILDAIKVRDRRRFVFDGDFNLRLRTGSDSLTGERLPEGKFWHFCTGADHDDDPYGLGLAHQLYWPVQFKRGGVRLWLAFLEKYAAPTAVGEYPPNTSQADQDKLLAATQAVQSDSGLIIPQGMIIKLLEPARSGTADYNGLHAAMNAMIAKAILSQTATTEGTAGKLGADSERGQVKGEIVKADADLVSGSFNRTVVRWLMQWNFPNAALPTVWRVMEDEEDLNQRAERDGKVFSMGFRPTLQHVQTVYGGEWEPVDATVLPDESVSPVEFAEADRDTLDALGDDLSSDWETLMSPMMRPVLAALEDATSYEEFQRGLDAIKQHMDISPMVDKLAQALFGAHLAGHVTDDV